MGILRQAPQQRGPGLGGAGHAPSASRPTTRHRRLRQPEHKVLQQLRNCGNDVFVVTEVLQTQKEVKVTRTQKQEGSGQFALPGALSLQVCGRGGTPTPAPSLPSPTAQNPP